MSNDIFDYFSGHSAKKVEPVDDELNDDLENEDASDVTAAEIGDRDFAASSEIDDLENVTSNVTSDTQELSATEPSPKLSHWDRLLGKLGISSPTPPPPQPPSREVSRKKKLKAKVPFKSNDKTSSTKSNEPFGGSLAPESEWKTGKRSENTDRGDEVIDDMPTERDESPAKKGDAAFHSEPSSSFAFGLFEEPESSALAESDEVESPLTEMFIPSDDFEAPFDGGIAEKIIDDLPEIVEIEEFVAEQSGTFDVDEDFVEFEVKELDFSDDRESPPPSATRRANARRDRSNRGARGRSREDQDERTDRGRTTARGGRNDDSEDIPLTDKATGDTDFAEEEIGEFEEPEKREPRRRRGSRGRGRGRREARPRSEQYGWDEPETTPLDPEDEQSDDLRDDDRDNRRHRERANRGSGRDRSEASNQDEYFDDFEEDDIGEAEPRSRRKRPPERESAHAVRAATDDGEDGPKSKRPHIPTWDEAITGMIESNIKSRSKSASGSRRPRRPRRK